MQVLLIGSCYYDFCTPGVNNGLLRQENKKVGADDDYIAVKFQQQCTRAVVTAILGFSLATAIAIVFSLQIHSGNFVTLESSEVRVSWKAHRP